MAVALARQIGTRRRRKPLWSSREAFLGDAGLFILGAAGAFSANVVGSLPGCEVLLFPMLPVLILARGRRAFSREYLLYYLFTGAWLLGTLIADTFAGSPPENRMKGTARVIFFALDFTALAILLNNKTRRMMIFALSIVAVMFYDTTLFKGEFGLQWKFGFAASLGILSMLISSHYYARRRYWICGLIALVLAVLNLIFAFRSQLVVVLISAVLYLPLSGTLGARRKGKGGGQNLVGLAMVLALAGGAAYASNEAIKYAARNGFFDESTQAKFETQAAGHLGVLVGGRPETLVALQAIRDSPIIGHGSFPYGPKYLQMKQDIQYKYGYSESDEPEEVQFQVIPTHSHLTLGWVESGILGGACWIYILVLSVRALLKLNAHRPAMAPLYCYLLVGFLWDILYSPFGSVNRIWGAYHILLSYFILKTSAADVLKERREKARGAIGRREPLLPRLSVSR